MVLFVAGCFDPHLTDGGFKCGPAGECPDGQHCEAGSCVYTRLSVTLPDGAPDGVAPPPPVKRKLEEPCDVMGLGTPSRSDNCDTGLRCIEGDNGAICLIPCVSSTGCPDARACEDRASPLTAAVDRVCALSTAKCDPLSPLTSCGGGRKCVLEGTRTICEISTGGNQGLSCRFSRECLPLYTCAASGPGVARCERLCSARSVCGAGTTCLIEAGSTYGYCF